MCFSPYVARAAVDIYKGPPRILVGTWMLGD